MRSASAYPANSRLDRKRRGPCGTGNVRQNIILGENMPASALQPYSRAETPLGEACGLKVNAGHSDEKITGSQTRHYREVQRLIE